MKKLAWAATQRQNYIGERLRAVGTLNRFDIEKEFGISAPQASIDIAYFISIYPDVMRYDKTLKSYVYLGEGEGEKTNMRTALTVAVSLLEHWAPLIKQHADMPEVFDNTLEALKKVLWP